MSRNELHGDNPFSKLALLFLLYLVNSSLEKTCSKGILEYFPVSVTGLTESLVQFRGEFFPIARLKTACLKPFTQPVNHNHHFAALKSLRLPEQDGNELRQNPLLTKRTFQNQGVNPGNVLMGFDRNRSDHSRLACIFNQVELRKKILSPSFREKAKQLGLILQSCLTKKQHKNSPPDDDELVHSSYASRAVNRTEILI
jgi:hypothetical protein